MKTPITDAEEKRQSTEYDKHREAGDPPFPADFEFARRLERQLAEAHELIRQLREAGSDLHTELVNARYRLRMLGSGTHDLPGNAAMKRWCKLTQ